MLKAVKTSLPRLLASLVMTANAGDFRSGDQVFPSGLVLQYSSRTPVYFVNKCRNPSPSIQRGCG